MRTIRVFQTASCAVEVAGIASTMDIILNLNGVEWRLDPTENYQSVKAALTSKENGVLRVRAGAAGEATDLHIHVAAVVSWAVYGA